jgi:hypothetical protein
MMKRPTKKPAQGNSKRVAASLRQLPGGALKKAPLFSSAHVEADVANRLVSGAMIDIVPTVGSSAKRKGRTT